MNNLYDGYIRKNRVVMSPIISSKGFEVDYNISAYPCALPKKFPQDLFEILPNKIRMNNYLIFINNIHLFEC
jgi:hypothetical protein